MKILMVSAEFAPWVKTGGLADASAGLAWALADRGHDVRVLFPRYEHLSAGDLPPSKDAGNIGGCHVLEAAHETGRPRLYLLEVPGLATDAVYSGDERDAVRFAHLAACALRLPRLLGWRPDILHCHDWHAGLLPGLQRTGFAAGDGGPVPTMLTIHNLGYQGVFAGAVVASVGISELEALAETSPDGSRVVSFLKSGILNADLVTTVSPTYAREIRTAEFGMGLEQLIRERGNAVIGILNGVDYRTWSPDRDPLIEPHYDAADPSPKIRVKQALCRRLQLRSDAKRPLVGLVTRLASQKGIDLFIDALPHLLEDTPAAFAVLGSGETPLEDALDGFATRHPDRVSFSKGFHESLAHQILAGSDVVLVPSRYEPCGLTQMYALRYGTIPVVRATGGLADTVEHFDPASGQGNGSVFEHADPGGLEWGLGRALEWFADESVWRGLVRNAMRADFSWQRQSALYERAYQGLIESTSRA